MRRTPPTENIPRIVYRRFQWRGRASSAAPARPVDAHSLFTKEYLVNNLIGLQVQGAGSEALISAMRQFAANKENASPELLEEIARLRGRNPDAFKAEYLKFQQRLQGQREKYTPLDESRHSSFMGSETQLRYGSLVGAALGMDPVLGSMLNPTGGLVGPGNTSIDCNATAVGYHGITHDAAGYLYNNHDLGPGYNYLGREKGLGVDTGGPFTGQREGIRFWRTEMPVGRDLQSDLAQLVVDGSLPGVPIGFRELEIGYTAWGMGKEAGAIVGDRVQEIGARAQDLGQKAEDRVRDTAAQVGERAHEVGQRVRDFGDRAEDRVRDTAAQVGERAHEVGQQVRDFGERAAERALDVGRWISRAVVERDLDHPWEM